MDKEGENVIVCGIALGLAVLGWAVSRKWGRKDWQKGAAVIAAAACLGLLSGYMELQTDEDPEKGLLRSCLLYTSWWISFNETVVICHTGGICDGSSNWTGEAAVSEANGGNIRESENTDSFFSDDFNWIFYCSLGVCH